MLRMFTILAGLVVATTLSAESPKPTPEKLVGTWKLTKSGDPLPPNTTAVLVLQKDGTFTMKLNVNGKGSDIPGTWKMDGSKLTVVQKAPDGKEHNETMSIQTLNDTTLVTTDEKGKKDEFERVTEKK